MLRKTTKKLKLGSSEVIVFPRYFKHFKEELYSSVLYSEDEPMLIIKINGEINFVRKRRPRMSYKFFDNDVETTLEAIAKEIKTLTEFKIFLEGVHPRFKVIDYREGKVYKNSNDPFKRSRYIEYASFDKRMIRKLDRKSFEPENALRLTEKKILRYFIHRKRCKVFNLNSPSTLGRKGVLRFVRRGIDELPRKEAKVFLFSKGKNYNDELGKELFRRFMEKDYFDYEAFVKNDVIREIGYFTEESIENLFRGISFDGHINVEPKDTTSYTFSDTFVLDKEEFPYFSEKNFDRLGIFRKSNRVKLISINFTNALEAGLIEFF